MTIRDERRYGPRRPAMPARAEVGPGEPVISQVQWSGIAVALFLVVIALYGWLWVVDNKRVGVALLLVPAMMALSAPIFLIAKRERAFDLAGLLATGLLLRFTFAPYRFSHAFDADTYYHAGVTLAQQFRHFDFSGDPGGAVPGTGAMKFITGVVSVVAGDNRFAIFLIFTWLSFFGCYLLYRAFRTAMPNGDRYRYALLVFLWPSLAFWPSSIGKESWMMLALGFACLGAARVYARRPAGYTLLVVGLFGGSLVRPHVMLIALIAFAIALIISRRTTARPGAITPSSVAKVAGLVIVVAIGGLLASRTESLLKVNDLSSSSIDSALTTTASQTALGRSSFSAPDAKNPIGYVEAAVTIVARPFPFEASGTEQVVTSFEGLLLGVLLLVSWRRLLSIPGLLRREPWIAFALAYFLMFVFAFAAISNFGILARQRVQVLPLLFVLLCVPAASTVKPSLRRSSA
jgi:hypothetical protein